VSWFTQLSTISRHSCTSSRALAGTISRQYFHVKLVSEHPRRHWLFITLWLVGDSMQHFDGTPIFTYSCAKELRALSVRSIRTLIRWLCTSTLLQVTLTRQLNSTHLVFCVTRPRTLIFAARPDTAITHTPRIVFYSPMYALFFLLVQQSLSYTPVFHAISLQSALQYSRRHISFGVACLSASHISWRRRMSLGVVACLSASSHVSRRRRMSLGVVACLCRRRNSLLHATATYLSRRQRNATQISNQFQFGQTRRKFKSSSLWPSDIIIILKFVIVTVAVHTRIKIFVRINK
jgi:hypothetical protein